MPINVTAADHENERRVIKRLVDLGLVSEGCKPHTDDLTSCFDATDKERKTYIEIRCRPEYTIDELNKLGGQYLNCDKAWVGVKIARNNGYRYNLVVECKDGLASAVLWNGKAHSEDFYNPVEPKKRKVSRGQDLNDHCFVYEIITRKIPNSPLSQAGQSQ